jgi:hypothetical protein
MSDLDRLDWPEFTALRVYGARIGIRSNDEAALALLTPVFPPTWKPSGGTRVDWLYSLLVSPPTRSGRKPFHSLYSQDERIGRARELSRLVEAFERDVQMAVAQAARRKVFVHAGAVGWRGRAILLPGRTFTGKSTLVRELVRAGAVYYSDEYAVLDSEGRVHPFPRPLSLRDDQLVNQKVSFQELGGKVGIKPLPVGTIVVTRFREQGRWRPQRLSPGIGTLELLANTVTARTHQVQVLQTLTRVSLSARIFKGTRGEARPFAAKLLSEIVSD